MKKEIVIGMMAATCWAFTSKKAIEKCYIDFKPEKELKASPAEKIVDAAKNAREVQTSKGKVNISRTELVRVNYKNDKGVIFATIEVEGSDGGSFSSDTTKVLDNLRYFTTMRKDLDEKGLKELTYNGYKIYGIRSNNTETDNKYLGIYTMFPENGVTVYVFFHKLKKTEKQYENLSDFQSIANGFLGNYTAFLKKCKGK